ncbi:MAG: lipase [Flavobacteriales bacterium 32-34-25]|nr:MAG: lipase [Flavobacteriales bacterium 32-34-25]
MKKRIVFLLLICSSIAFSQEKYTVKSNIPYYETQSQDVYQNERCVLDIYYPQNAKNFATIVWFHGGGLTSGSKEIPEALKNKGYCIIGVNYRLSPKAKAPAYIEDAAAAVAWTFKNIEKYGGNSNSIFVSGHSAGGYLTAMVGLDKKWLQAHQIDANKIAGLIPFSCQAITHFTIRSENGISDTQPIVDQYAPLFHVRKDAPPLLLITGDRELEMLGRYEENAYFMRMMKVVGHTETKLLELDRYDHGGMAQPAFPILIKEMRRILDLSK